MDITETDKYYVVTFFPNAEEIEIDDKPEKGYKAIIGLQDDEHIVMKVMYDKNIYPYDEDDRRERFGADYEKDTVKTLAGNIKECPICKRLNANVAKIGRVQLYDRASAPMDQPIQVASVAPVASSSMFNTGNAFDDIIAQMLYNTKLNKTGQMAVALGLGDAEMVQKAMPATIEGVIGLVADITELTQNKGNLFRSPKEVTEYVQALRDGAKPADEKATEKDKPVVFRRASTIIVS